MHSVSENSGSADASIASQHLDGFQLSRMDHRIHRGGRGQAQALGTGVAAALVLVLAASVYPVIHSRKLETVEVLRST